MAMTTMAATLTAVSVAGGVPSAQAPGEHPRGYVAYRAAAPVVIDGRLDDSAWRDAPWSDTFVDIEGAKKPRPRFDTRMKMLWDGQYLYIGADLREPHLWATLTQHDSVIFRDHDFEVFIDPNGDNHEYYEFEINALGTTWDLLLPKPYRDDGKAVNGWEIAGVKSGVHLDGTLNHWQDEDRGWSVELALPWAALGELARRPSPPGDGDQWRINFSRVEWQLQIPRAPGEAYTKVPDTKEDNWVWSPQHVIDMHRPEQWGYVQFSTAAPGTAAFVPDPSWPARRWLHEVYAAQHAYRKVRGTFAPTLTDLGVAPPTEAALSSPSLTTAGALFEAGITLTQSGRSERWTIRQDSLLNRPRNRSSSLLLQPRRTPGRWPLVSTKTHVGQTDR